MGKHLLYLNDLRSDAHFEKLFEDSKALSTDLSLEMPSLPRRKKAPRKMRDYYGQLSKDHACESVEQFFRNQFFEVIDLITTKIKDRFDQKTLNLLISIEEIMINAAGIPGRRCEDG